MKFGKGQTSIEYLANYGWMLVAAAAVGSTVYTQIPAECTLETQGFDENVEISQLGINEDEELLLSLRKKTTDPVDVKQLRLNRSGEVIYQNQSIRLETRNEKATELTEVERTTGCQQYQLTVIYDKGPVPSIKETTILNIPVQLAQVVKPYLEIFGGEINSVSTNSTILATNNTVCIGGNCPSNNEDKKYKDAEYVNRSGDEMTGTLYTDKINWSCIGGNCPVEKGTLQGYVSNQNNTLDGTLNVTEIKPENNLCMGKTC